MEETNNQILRIVVDFNVFDKKTINIKFKNIEHQAQQFGGGRRKECIYWGRSSGDSDVILQKIHIE